LSPSRARLRVANTKRGDRPMAREQSLELVQSLPDPSPAEKPSPPQETSPSKDEAVELLLLVSVLRSRDPARRLAAARALQRTGPPAVPVLLAALQDDSEAPPRESYIKALGRMGPAARAALPALEALVEDDALGAAAREAVRAIRRGWRPDWKQL